MEQGPVSLHKKKRRQLPPFREGRGGKGKGWRGSERVRKQRKKRGETKMFLWTVSFSQKRGGKSCFFVERGEKGKYLRRNFQNRGQEGKKKGVRKAFQPGQVQGKRERRGRKGNPTNPESKKKNVNRPVRGLETKKRPCAPERGKETKRGNR